VSGTGEGGKGKNYEEFENENTQDEGGQRAKTYYTRDGERTRSRNSGRGICWRGGKIRGIGGTVEIKSPG